MPLVNVLINGRAYSVACDPGQENHVQQLARLLDKKVNELVASVGQAGDARLLVMAGLVLCDELEEARRGSGGSAPAGAEDKVAEALENAAARLEAIAARVSST
jgi:cell division protein ZapA